MNNNLLNFGNKVKQTFGKVSKKDSSKKGAVKEFIAKLSRGLMLPIAILPIAGLFLGIGAAIANNAHGNNGLEIFGNFLKIPGDVIFGALPVLFAIAIAIAFTRDAGPAGLAALVGFLVFSGTQAALISEPITATDGSVGYNLLYYLPGSLGFNEYGLPASLFGSVLGIKQVVTSVFGGFIVGFTVAFLYNKFKNIELPKVLGFFNGVRFIPIITFVTMIPVALLVLMIWPLVGMGFNYLGIALGGNLYGFNSFIFGYIERSLVPFGLHHAFYSPLWYTSAGGELALGKLAITASGMGISLPETNQLATWGEIAQANGYTGSITGNIQGDQSLWAFANSYLVGKNVYFGTYAGAPVAGTTPLTNSALGQISFSDLSAVQGDNAFNQLRGVAGINIGQYLQGKYVFMMFGLPAAAVAMILTAPKENRKLALSIIASAAFTCFLTGITEPLEFTFLFLAPWLFWGFHAFMCALAFGFMNWVGLILAATGNAGLAPHIGMSFSGGLIDWIIYGGIQIQFGSNAWWSLVFGVIYVPIYFFFFYWAIKKFNIATPGRGDNTKLFTKEDWKNKNNSNSKVDENRLLALNVVKAYGGFDNIKNVDACITKLRIQVANQDIVDGDTLTNKLGASGVIKPSKQSVYAVYGAKADRIKSEINDMIYDIEQNPKLKEEYMKLIEDNTNAVATEKPTTATSDEEIIIKSPLTGKIIPLSKVPDETFSKEMMGKGIAIEPTSNKAVSPIDGKISLAFDTGHAYIFESSKGTQVLVHIGIDSIGLKDSNNKEIKVFTPSIKTEDKVKTGDAIASFELAKLNKHAKSSITPIVVLNETLNGREVKLVKKEGTIKAGEPLFIVTNKK